MQTELGSPRASGPRWAPGRPPLVSQGSAGGPARTFVSQRVPAGQTDRKDPQNFTPSLKFPSVFSAECRNGGRAGGLLKAPPLPSHLYLITSQCQHSCSLIQPPPPFFSSPPCYFLPPLLFLSSSVVLSVFALPPSLNAPRGPRVTQTEHCLTSTSTSCSCLGKGGGGWVVVRSSPGSSRPLGSKSGTRLTLRTWS